VAGKLLWIQDLVQSGQTMLVQIPTVWNVSDIGTKPLSTKRIKVLLHELGMCENEGAYAVGQAETEEQAARHGGSKGFTLLAKNVSRVLMMWGPGPTGVFGMVLHDDGVDADQCKLEQPNAFKDETFSFGTILTLTGIFILVILAWST
jgi:hypothetical protein